MADVDCLHESAVDLGVSLIYSGFLLNGMEPEFLPGRSGWWGEQRAQLLVHIAQNDVVRDHLLIQFREALEDRGVGQQSILHLHESPNDIHAHRNRTRAPQNRGRHDCAVLGEAKGLIAPPTMAIQGCQLCFGGALGGRT